MEHYPHVMTAIQAHCIKLSVFVFRCFHHWSWSCCGAVCACNDCGSEVLVHIVKQLIDLVLLLRRLLCVLITLLHVCPCSDDFLSAYRYKPGITSPLSIDDPVQRIRQQNAVARFNDMFAQDRLDAMDTLRRYSDDHENNQRIIFAALTVSWGWGGGDMFI